jgi:Cys-tRNA(Pro)/Cys-tRNA(Cys) deacylase
VTQKTNRARLSDQLGIRYELREHELDPEDLAGETVAAKIGRPPAQVFQTQVAHGNLNAICMAVISGDKELKLQELPGKKEYPVSADETIERFELISISAGRRGLQILLTSSDYLRVRKAKVAAFAQASAKRSCLSFRIAMLASIPNLITLSWETARVTKSHQASNVSNDNGITTTDHQAQLFPLAELPVQSEERHCCHLRQRLLRDVDFEMAVDFAAYLVQQTNQSVSQARRDRSCTYFAKAAR